LGRAEQFAQGLDPLGAGRDAVFGPSSDEPLDDLLMCFGHGANSLVVWL
jgi:hypothetical protein